MLIKLQLPAPDLPSFVLSRKSNSFQGVLRSSGFYPEKRQYPLQSNIDNINRKENSSFAW